MTERSWVEKYRPDTLDGIIGHDAVVRRMQQFVDDPAMPNLLFAGKQGIGKTAIVQAFCKAKYGSSWRNFLLEMNASDERGIGEIQGKVKDFARRGAGDQDFKIIFLDEADQLTRDAQPALRRIMEDWSDTTRFILSCNYPNQIIDPIQSRCAVFRLTALSDKEVFEVLERVADAEIGLDNLHPDAADMLVQYARGDARKVINQFQALVLDDALTVQDVQELIGLIPEAVVEEIMDEALNGDIDEAMQRLDDDILKTGSSLEEVLDSFHWEIKKRDVPGVARYRCIDAIGEADWRIRRGANPHIQLHALLANLLVAYHSGIADDS